MKRFLMAAIAVFVMSGTSFAAGSESYVVVDNSVVGNQQKQNVIDKMIALVKGFTKKVNAVKSIDELMTVAEKCYSDMMEFEEKYEEEIMMIEEVLTEQQMEAYEAKMDKALEEFETAVEKKTEQLTEDFDFDFDF